MNSTALEAKLKSILKDYWLPIVIGVLGVIFLGYGLIYLMGSSSSDQEIVFEAGENSTKPREKILVDVGGAVVSPGVYTLDDNARLQDALIAAGGLSKNADREWIAKNLNLATVLSDAAKIYIPSINENSSFSGASTGGNVAGVAASGQININSASESELDTLYGVGPVTAQKIIDNRPYATIDDLLSKKVVSSRVFDQIKDKITAF